MSELTGNKFIGDGQVLPADYFQGYLELTEKYPTVYEVIRIEEGIPLFLEDYMERLLNSFHLMDKPLPCSPEEIGAAMADLVYATPFTSGPVKLVFSAGTMPFFYVFRMKPHLPSEQEYLTGVRTVFMEAVRENPNLKLWNSDLRERSSGLLSETGAYEAILVDPDGFITEASRSNVFFIRGKEVFTTGEEAVLPGITRKKVIEVCRRHDIPVHYVSIPASEAGQFDSCFLTGTARKIVPVRSVGDVDFKVGNPLFRDISGYFDRFVGEYIRERS